MYDIRLLRPVKAGPKVRLGKLSDGGYVLLREQIAGTKILLSFGVATDWSFEEHFARENTSVEILMYDYSTSLPMIGATMIVKLLKFDFPKAGHYLRAATRYLSFISPGRRARLTGKYLALDDTAQTVRFDTIMLGLVRSGISPGSIFVKLDIEGAEYRVLESIIRHSEFINGLAIEFHELDPMGSRLNELMHCLKKNFHVAHVHGNNYSPLISSTDLPVALEVTFVHKRMVGEELSPDDTVYPIPGLDYPNHPDRIDYPLHF